MRLLVGDLARWPLRRQRWVWVLPIMMYEVAKREQTRLQTGIELLVAVALVILVARRPGKALAVFIVVLPFSTFILAALLRLGAPSAAIRGLGFWKEGIIAGVAVAGLRRMLRTRTRLDRLDKLIVAYLVLGTLYLVLPKLLDGTLAGAFLSLHVRELGWRSDVMYLGVFLFCRYLGLSRQQVEALFRRLLVVAVLVALIGLYEYAAPGSFNHFVVHTIRVPSYEIRVLHVTLKDPTTVLTYSSTGHHVRVGSVLLNYLTVGFYFIFALGIAIELLSRGQARTWVAMSIPILGTALLVVQSRAAILGGAVTVLLGLRRQIGRSLVQRVRLTVMLSLGLLVFIPVIVISGLGHRFVGSRGTDNTLHNNSVHLGINIMVKYPLGLGLGTGAGGGQVAQTEAATSNSSASIPSVFIPEDQWLQIGTQIGVIGLIIYVAALVLIVRRLYPRTHDPGIADGSVSAGGARTALIGILVGGLFLQPFVEPVVSWTVFALCGLAAAEMDRLSNGAATRAEHVSTLPDWSASTAPNG
ncbi:MAG: O-antigen ligase family protein [Acidimicrobiales bacterium]